MIKTTTSFSINDYVKQVKVMYDLVNNIVVKLMVVSKYGVKYDFGRKGLAFPTGLRPWINLGRGEGYVDDGGRRDGAKGVKEGEERSVKFYQYDISAGEYPSFMFGGYVEHEGIMVLSALGMIVNSEG